MPAVKFTSHLNRFFPTLQQNIVIEGSTIAEIVAGLERQYPGMADYLVDERGVLRKHVNIFIDEDLIRDRQRLSDVVTEQNRVFIFQALSGG
jgi:molybdopterin synthase sulfur carrier subunit